jgi:hypothetical protein
MKDQKNINKRKELQSDRHKYKLSDLKAANKVL